MTITVERNVPIPMRDGTILKAELFLPAGGPAPALLQRTPYDKTLLPLATLVADPLRLAEAGYAVVIQDVRGRYASGGEFRPFEHDGEDGYDTVEWCAAQAWSDGNVGMYGASYPGLLQLQTAALRPPHLRAIAPAATGADLYDHWLYPGAAFALGFGLSWSTLALAPNALARRASSVEALASSLAVALDGVDALPGALSRLPLRPASDDPIARVAPWYGEWLDHPARDEYWRARGALDDLAEANVPMFFTGGWYDVFLGGTLASYARRLAGRVGPHHDRLLIGPWFHGFPWLDGPVGEVGFGARASGRVIDHQGMQIRWFDRWLKGREAGNDAPVRIFVMGRNEWRDEQEWPLQRATPTFYYLHSRGSANTAAGDGFLSPELPSDEPPDTYVYDPRDPTPTVGGNLCCSQLALPAGAYDQRRVEARPDVLCYTTSALDADLEVIGPIQLVLHASSSAADTDFCGKLVDVHPDGTAVNLCDGIVRARYRADRAAPESLEPGRAYEFTIDLWATANVFRRGHRIRIEVASANYPRFNRNPNTGGSLADETEQVPARQRVFHDAVRPSRVVLPVLPA